MLEHEKKINRINKEKRKNNPIIEVQEEDKSPTKKYSK